MLKLSERAIAALAVPTGKAEVWVSDSEVTGLRLRATVGAKNFLACWTDRATGERRRERLGAWGAITLDQAREAARIRLGEVAKGSDPKATRTAQRDAAAVERAERALTLEALVDDWAALHLASKRPRYSSEAVRAIKYAFAKHLKRPAAKMTKAEAVAVLDAILKAGNAAMAGRTLAYGRACYAWAEKRGKVADNPFEKIPIATGTVSRDRVLSDDEAGRVWNAALAMPQPWGPLIRLLMLSLARRDEVAGMRWSEISADGATWTIPPARMKRGQAHVLALSDAARAALASVTRIKGQDLVFTTTGKTPVSGFTKAKAALDKAAKVNGWRLHDLRRTGASALAAMGFNGIVADKLLAHQPAALSAVARVYQRHDYAAEKAKAWEAWGAHVARCASGNPASDKVADFAAHRRAVA